MGSAEGQLFGEFEVTYDTNGFAQFLIRIDWHGATAARVPMAGYNGWPHPLSQMILTRG